jgi:bacillithiol biosynthesis deacetylase BshB1
VSACDVVAFGPHPDDVELCCGGLVAKLVALGHRVALVDLTRGEMSTRGTVDERAGEASEAARVLGVAQRANLALPDGGLRGDDDAHAAAVAHTLRTLRPELVLAPWAVERHPDHEAAHALVRRAVFLAGLRKWAGSLEQAHRPRTVLWYPMRHIAEPSFVVDVSAHYETKRAAIQCHRSQVSAPPGTAPGSAAGAATLVGSALSLSSLEARDAFYGAQIGVAFGEPFIVDEAVAIDDPVAHFRGRPPALFFPARTRGGA